AVAGGGGSGGGPCTGWHRAARLGMRQTPRSGEPRALVSSSGSATAPEISGAALAGSNAEQPAAAGELLRRSRTRADRDQEPIARVVALDAFRRGRDLQDSLFPA